MPWSTLAVLLAACGSAAATGALFKPGSWYKGLTKPAWTPPDWLFPVAWTALYIAIAVAAWRFAATGHGLVPLGLALWAWQLALNALWSPVFFGLRRLRTGMVVMSLLWLVIAAGILVFARVDAVSAWLLVPYWLWISYAAALNLVIWRRNPGEKPLIPSEQPRP
jgi:tryptophan-rich sensory protein